MGVTLLPNFGPFGRGATASDLPLAHVPSSGALGPVFPGVSPPSLLHNAMFFYFS